MANFCVFLSEIESCAFTIDLWTSQALHSYMGITVHYIDNAWRQKMRYLECFELPGSRTAENVGKAVDAILTAWQIKTTDEGNKAIAAISDNGANVVNALNDVARIRFVFGCISHTINLAVEKGMASRHVAPLMAKARRLVGHFSKSPQARYALRDAQVAAGVEHSNIRELVQDVSTRWMSA